MSNPITGPTAAQRAWVKSLGTLATPAGGGGGVAVVAAPSGAPRSNLTETVKLPLAGDKQGVTSKLFDPTDIPGLLLKTVTGPHSSVCRINNNTDVTLRMAPRSAEEIDSDDKGLGLSFGKFDSLPPDPIGPRSSGEFKASSNTFIGQALSGVEGRVRYFLDDQGTTWSFHHDNPKLDSNNADAQIDGPNKAKFVTPKPVAGGGSDAVYLFTLNQVGGAQPPPPPPPGPVPVPTTDTKSSCLITVKNNTKQVLKLLKQGHERGDFMTFPASPLQPGGTTTFASVETPNAKEQGCKGFLEWDVGSPTSALWRMEWDNPEQAKNTTKVNVNPPLFLVLDQIGQGEDNVPVSFTITEEGGTQPPPIPPPIPPPVPPPVPPPEELVEFNPPVEARQPTLRKGDKSVDGWVEYAQTLLNDQLKINLVVDGDFGSGTQAAVFAFQKKEGLQQDGTIGNQTWAALRKGQPEKVGTDGRKPHTFVEKGAEARWDTEQQNAVFLTKLDEMLLFITSVGDAKIDDSFATIRVTPPNTPAKTVKVKIGPPTRTLPSGAGHNHVAKLNDFRKRFPATDPNAKVTDYKLEAFLDKELGGDLWTGGKVVEG